MKKKFLAVILLSAMLATSALSGCGCANKSATADEAVETSVQTVTEIATDEQENTFVTEATKVVEVKETQDGSDTAENATQPTTQGAKTNSKSNENVPATTKPSTPSTQSKTSSSDGSASSGTNTANSSTSSKSNSSNSSSGSSRASSGKTWHEAVYKTVNHPAETEKVWVVDKEAYTYDKPIYEQQERAICSDCHEDITDLGQKGIVEHIQEHRINGEKGGWYSDVIEVQVGTETVEVPEEGHWETKVVKEAWTERVLVKEAGYY